jgi:hypothetical protein
MKLPFIINCPIMLVEFSSSYSYCFFSPLAEIGVVVMNAGDGPILPSGRDEGIPTPQFMNWLIQQDPRRGRRPRRPRRPPWGLIILLILILLLIVGFVVWYRLMAH